MGTLENLNLKSEKEFEEYSIKYPEDIGRLYNSYKALCLQKNGEKNYWSEEFLKGYLSTITDLIIIKKGHWGN